MKIQRSDNIDPSLLMMLLSQLPNLIDLRLETCVRLDFRAILFLSGYVPRLETLSMTVVSAIFEPKASS